MGWPKTVERTVQHAIEAAKAGTPSVLDITGHAGYGKSYLARWVARQFPPEQVLRATAYSSDRADSLGVLRQLDPDLPAADPNPLRVARRIGQRIDQLQITGPVALLIDDLHWADPESVEAVGVLLERMAGDRVLIVTAHRPGGPRSRQWAALIDAAPAVFRVWLDGLDDESTLQLVRDNHPESPAVLAARLRQHTGGSPLFLRSLLQEYSPRALESMSDRGRLPAPTEVVAAMRDRLSQFDPDVVTVLEALAVIGDGGADAFVIAAVADVDDVDAALAALKSERLVVVEDDPLPRSRLFHGVLRAAIYANIPTQTRQRLHGRAAARLASPRDRLEHRVAAARAADDGLAADLDAFADDLHDQRQYRAAARFRRQAAVLSSTPDARNRRERDADFESILALDMDNVSAAISSPDPDPRIRFTIGARLVAEHRYVAAADILESLSEAELSALGDITAYRARVLRGWTLVSAGRSPERAFDDLTAAARSAVTDPALQGYFSIAYGQAALLAAPPAERPDLDELMAGQRSALATTPAGLTRLAWRGTSMSLIGIQKMAIADLDIVISRLGDGIVDFGDGAFYAFQGLAYFLDGQWARASISLDLARTGQLRYPAPLTSSLLPLEAVIGGDAERTRDALQEARRIRVQSPQPAAVTAGDIVEVCALALLGTSAEREQWLGRRIADFGEPRIQPEQTPSMLGCVIQSIAASWAGRPDAALYWAELLRRTPIASWTNPVAQWLAARTQTDDIFSERVEPISLAGVAEMPILEALIHLDLAGRGTRAVGRAARDRATRAFNDFGGDRLLPTLFRSGDTADSAPAAAKSPVLAPLSDREREIATLLLEGLSYAQIGKELFITRSTVSFHLTRIYAKTGTTSRHELAQAIHHRTL